MERVKNPARKVKLFFFIALLILVALSFFTYVRIATLVSSAEIVTRSNIIKLELERTFSFLKEAETGQRGYLLTKEKSYLNPYNIALQALEGQFVKLQQLLEANEQQIVHLATLRSMVTARTGYLDQIIIEDSRGLVTDSSFIPGKQMMDKIRAQIQRMMRTQDEMLDKQSDVLDKNVYLTPVVMLLFIGFSLALLVYAYRRINKDLKKSIALSAQLQVQNERTEERNRFIEEILNASVDLVAVVDQDHQLLIVNNRAAKFFGQSREMLVGKKVDELLPGLVNESAFPSLDKALKGEPVHIQEYRSPINDRFWELNFVPLKFSHGVGSVMIIVHEITELLNVRNSLRASEDRYHRMIEEITDYAIIFLNENGIIENWNKGAQRIKGYSAEEILGKHFEIFYPPDERTKRLPHQLLNEAKTSGKAVHEGWRVRKDGSYFWGSIVITAVYNDEGQIIGFSKVTRDLTQKKIADDKIQRHATILEEKNADLENMNRELQSFAYISSHDLQEPLRKIQTFTDRIVEIDEQNLSEKGKDYFRRMKESARRMQNLIQDLLEYARAGVVERKYESVLVSEMVHDLQEEFKDVIASSNTNITLTSDCRLNVIRFQFLQLLHNLFSNAVKFAKPDVESQITISCHPVQDAAKTGAPLIENIPYLHLRFADNGIGFDQQYSKRIFEVFQRLHGRYEFQGTGIGLAICKKIVDNHHGFITAEGELGKGAVFNIYLPA